jgi:two-component system chemotaxis sensor kinase CheA
VQFDEIQEIFFQECEEGLAAAEVGLLAFKSGQEDGDTINTIFRAVHSIKGGAGAFGFDALQGFTHKFETVLDLARDGTLPITPGLVGVLLRAFDMLSDHISAIRGEGESPEDGEVIALLEATAEGKSPDEATAEAPAAAAEEDNSGLDFSFDDLMQSLGEAEVTAMGESSSASSQWSLEVRPGKGALANGGEPMLLIRELLALGAIFLDTDVSAIPTLDEFETEGAYLGWTFTVPMRVTEQDVREIFDFVLDSCDLLVSRPEEDEHDDHHEPVAAASAPEPAPAAEAAPEPVKAESPAAPAVVPAAKPAPKAAAPAPAPAPAAAPQSLGAGGQTIRVDLEKLDRLVNLVGELVITQAMLAQKLSLNGLASMNELTDLDQLTRELQDSAMSIRAQPIKSVFSRVPRIVRELEQQTGKQVVLEVEGEMTELDKTVVERIGEPLTHLIRNAIDHGLESPEDRVAAGKAAQGVVRLSAEHRGGKILICVSDDGAGINRTRVRQKAIDRGLIAPDANLSDEEIDNLIFAPGFSTAEAVTNVSGRGVGMDVVRKNVEALGGRISIQSRPGFGSTFTLALPLTLAILDGMIVSVGSQTYVIPLTHIVESLRPQAHELKSIGNGKQMLNVRGTFLPIEPVGVRLGIDAVPNPTDAVLIVVDTETSGQSVLMVDAILDQRQVVIKSLETNYRPVDGLAGATILGDGRVALILDVESLTATMQKRLAA